MFKKVTLIFFILAYSALLNAGTGITLKQTYYPNGKVKSAAHYNSAGQLEGEYIEYYMSGEICSIKSYSKGILHGGAQYYYDNGPSNTIYRSENYDNGKLYGLAYEYYKKGATKSKEQWREGKMLDKSFDYYNDDVSKKYKERIYNNGELQKEIVYDKKGKKLHATSWFGDVVIYGEYYQGNIAREIYFDKDKIPVSEKEFDDNEDFIPPYDAVKVLKYLGEKKGKQIKISNYGGSYDALMNDLISEMLGVKEGDWGDQELSLLLESKVLRYVFMRLSIMPEQSPYKADYRAAATLLTERFLNGWDGTGVYIEGVPLWQKYLMLEYERYDHNNQTETSYEKKFMLSYLDRKPGSEAFSSDIETITTRFFNKLQVKKDYLQSTGILDFLLGTPQILYDGYMYKLINEVLPATKDAWQKGLLLDALMTLSDEISSKINAPVADFPELYKKVYDLNNYVEHLVKQPDNFPSYVKVKEMNLMLNYLGKKELSYGDKTSEADMDALRSKTVEECFNKLPTTYKNLSIDDVSFLLGEKVSPYVERNSKPSFLNDILLTELKATKDETKATSMSLTINKVLDATAELLKTFSSTDINTSLGAGVFESWQSEYLTAYSEKRKIDAILGTAPSSLQKVEDAKSGWNDDRITKLYTKLTDINASFTAEDVAEAVEYMNYLLSGLENKKTKTERDSDLKKCTSIMASMKSYSNSDDILPTLKQKIQATEARVFKAGSNVLAYANMSNIEVNKDAVIKTLSDYLGITLKEAESFELKELEKNALYEFVKASNNKTAGAKEVDMLAGKKGFLHFLVDNIDTPAKAAAFHMMSEFVEYNASLLTGFNEYAWNECLIKYDIKTAELKEKFKDFDADFNSWVEKAREKGSEVKIKDKPFE